MKPGKRTLHWQFPLPRTHTGVVLGNGVQGLMVWGGCGGWRTGAGSGNWAAVPRSSPDVTARHTTEAASSLNVTISRAGFWDHRGGKPFSTNATYAAVRKLLESGDAVGLDRLFGRREAAGRPALPQQLGGGRLELTFPGRLTPAHATLEVATATLRVRLAGPGRRRFTVTIRQAMDQELAWTELPPALRGKVRVRLRPAWDFIGSRMAEKGLAAPERFVLRRDGHPGGGFVQRLPEDDALAIAWLDRGSVIVLATALGKEPRAEAVRRCQEAGLAAAKSKALRCWAEYWRDVPRVSLPDPVLQRLYDYGLFKQAGLTTPGGPAATLQGPWMEEYQYPPWSNDYHFNINVQMVYWPALATNRLSHFAPLWTMLKSWFPVLYENGRRFFEVPPNAAMLLPHGVDDRCRVIGSFWTGTIDHACTAWMALMAWLHYRYGLDEGILRELAWPLLNGAFEGYWAMCEEVTAAAGVARLSLPVSVSPEYNGAGLNAWGRDASFQLAAAHATARALQQAAAVLRRPLDPRWQRLRDGLPPYSVAPRVLRGHHNDAWCPRENAPRSEEDRPHPHIGLWAGKDLDASHRHHSHLGAFYPFRTVDPLGPAHAEIARNTMEHWTKIGMGGWSGWSYGWAAALRARCNDADAAVALLHWFDQVFCNEGGGTRHDALFPGGSRICRLPVCSPERPAELEIMQCDAAMGALNAILELLVQCRGENGERIVVLPRIPLRWRELSFNGIRTEGAFLVGATVKEGQVVDVRVTSVAGGRAIVEHQLGDSWTCDGRRRRGPLAELDLRPGQHVALRRV